MNPIATAASDEQNLIIEGLDYEGNANSRCDFILRKYYQKVGDVLDPKEITDARLRLNTMSQFYYARARLDKGSEKGKVIVVFIVIEASRIRYSLSLGADWSDSSSDDVFTRFESSSRSGGLSGRISNTNFLGSGKTLSFGFNNSQRDSTTKFIDYGSAFGSSSGGLLTSESQSRNTGFNLNYFDPYLFGSSRYFLNAGLSYHEFSSKNRVIEDTRDDALFRPQENDVESDDFALSVSAGRNIGRFSYLDVSVLGSEDSRDVYSLGYGWNTEDNLVFATKGDRFDLRVSAQESSNIVNSNYAKNLSISGRQVVTLGASVSYFDFSNPATLYSVFAEYNRANVFVPREGKYSGWFLWLSLSGGDQDFQTESIAISWGYKYQSKGMNLNFAIAYSRTGEFL